MSIERMDDGKLLMPVLILARLAASDLVQLYG
jgi:hypothetical protein